MVLVDVMSVSVFTGNMNIWKRRSFESNRFVDAFGKFRKATFSFVMSVQPSVRLFIGLEQLGYPWTNFHDIRYLSFFFFFFNLPRKGKLG